MQFELTDNSILVQWIVQDSAWDARNHILNRPLRPGESVGLSLLFDVPKELQMKDLIYEGNLRVIDYRTKEQLAMVPVKIMNSNMKGKGSGRDCCTLGGDCCTPQ